MILWSKGWSEANKELWRVRTKTTLCTQVVTISSEAALDLDIDMPHGWMRFRRGESLVPTSKTGGLLFFFWFSMFLSRCGPDSFQELGELEPGPVCHTQRLVDVRASQACCNWNCLWTDVWLGDIGCFNLSHHGVYEKFWFPVLQLQSLFRHP